MLAPNPNTPKPGNVRNYVPKRVQRGMPVNAVRADGTVCATYRSIIQAARAVDRNRGCILRAVENGTRSAGLFWRYADMPDSCQPLRPLPEREPEPVDAVPVPTNPVVVVYTPAPRIVVDKVSPTDGGHPGRFGYDAAAWAEAEHRGRYERLRQIDPTLTWEDWTQLTDRRPPGRQPKPGGHAEQQAARAKRRAERKAARGGWAWEGAGEESE